LIASNDGLSADRVSASNWLQLNGIHSSLERGNRRRSGRGRRGSSEGDSDSGSGGGGGGGRRNKGEKKWREEEKAHEVKVHWPVKVQMR
jgi:hypothetical protein